MSPGTSSECRANTRSFYGLNFASTVNIFFVWKNDFTLLRARFQQTPKKNSSLSFRTVRCWRLFSFKGESLRSVFTIVRIYFGSILKSRAIFSWNVLSLHLLLVKWLWFRYSYDMSKGVRFLDDLWCCWALCISSPHHKLWILVLLAALLYLMWAFTRDKIQ